ncbi:hypothetical protein KR222_008655 [Zaprionus bogoriensis]|nr:hypothetical protein KR222_008655 [Zaprionus bogoriensis]
MYPIFTYVIGGMIRKPDEFSWMASLQYGNRSSFGDCGGSVINSMYVLTAAHCLCPICRTGVRLGDFKQEPYCDYGSPDCQHYQLFGIAEQIVHENYSNFHNDIALLRLDRRINFTDKLRPVCLPFDLSELNDKTGVTIAGWGLSYTEDDKPLKRSVNTFLWNQTLCLGDSSADENQICGGDLSVNGSTGASSCSGDSGGPVMREFKPNYMALEGIISHGVGGCISEYFPSYFTRVRSFLSWIDDKICME